MKAYNLFVLLLFFMLIIAELPAQVGINPNGSEPDVSAMLDVASSDKGMLIPRMTAQQRDNISQPADGLLVYLTDDNHFYYFDGIKWDKVGPEEENPPIDSLLGKRVGNPNYNILKLNMGDGSLGLANDGVRIAPDGTLKFKTLDIKGASQGTNSIPIHASTNTDKWLNFRSSGGNNPGRAGALFSSRNFKHFFLYSENQELKIDFSSQQSGNPDVDNAAPLMKLNSNGLVLTRAPKWETGNEDSGKILSADADGKADWVDRPSQADRVVYTFDNNRQSISGSGNSSWVVTSPFTDWLTIENGQFLTIRATFAAELPSGSGNDPIRFRILSEGQSGCITTSGGTTDFLDVYQEIRGHSIQTTLQRAFISNCTGAFRFALETDCSATDDDIELEKIEITAVKY